MPWQEVSRLSLRRELVELALKEERSIAELCRRFGISRKTGYKWIDRYRGQGLEGLNDCSRRPHRSPNRTPKHVEDLILGIRKQHRVWGGRKIRRSMIDRGYQEPPSSSTITEVLRRNDLLDPAECAKHGPWKRFEQDAPNVMWQMDFKGHFAIGDSRCYPLTVLDDYSRYAIGLQACHDERRTTVEPKLIDIFRRYGLPYSVLVDNGNPWGYASEHPHTKLSVWLIRLGITVIHASVGHPQTLGKDERFHRTLKAEVIHNRMFRDFDDCQGQFDDWRHVYNFERPHEALGMEVPASRYQMSPRPFPDVLPAIEYAPGDIVRKVQYKGEIFYKNKVYTISRAFHGYPVALRPSSIDGVIDVYFCHQKIAEINLILETKR